LEEASTLMTSINTRTTSNNDTSNWHRLEGIMIKKSSYSVEKERRGREHQQGYRDRDHQKNSKGRSVYIVRKNNNYDSKENNNINNDYIVESDSTNSSIQRRPVGMKWKKIVDNDNDDDIVSKKKATKTMKMNNRIKPEFTLLLVRTSDGARHMVRALLAQVGGCPIIGDVRYWVGPRTTTTTTRTRTRTMNTNNNNDEYNDHDNNDHDVDIVDQYSKKNLSHPLQDRSVALHAYGVYFDKEKLKLGTLNTFEFRAPIPTTWKTFFGLDRNRVIK